MSIQCSNQTGVPFSKVCPQVLVCPCCWTLSWCPWNQKCHSNPGCPCMKGSGSLHKGMDMGITHVVSHVHVYTMFYQVFPQRSNDHHSDVPFGSPLLLLMSSSRFTWVLAGVAVGVDGVVPGLLSSSDELHNSHLCTGLGGACNMFRGVTWSESKKACSMLETWWILSIFLSGLGKLIVSEPLS